MSAHNDPETVATAFVTGGEMAELAVNGTQRSTIAVPCSASGSGLVQRRAQNLPRGRMIGMRKGETDV